MTEYLKDNIGPDEMVAICWLYATVKYQACKCHLWANAGECTRCKSLRMARVAWPYTVGFIEGVN